jgi:starch synthase
VFNDFNPAGLESALIRAIGMWYEYPQHFRELMVNGMRSDFSWNHPGRDYLKVYDHIREK